MAAENVFQAKYKLLPIAPLLIRNEQRELAAWEDVSRADFDGKSVRQIRLLPACRILGQVTSVALWQSGRPVRRTIVYPSKPGAALFACIECVYNGPHFDLTLPPGDYDLQIYGTDSQSVYRFVHIEPGQRELKLFPDLPPQLSAEYFGQLAPPLQQIKGWKNGKGVSLSDLKGKLVLLDFWGYWCGPCVAEMPYLMKLHDEFHDKGLVIVAVHDDSVESIAEMDQKLQPIRATRWAGRDLPFLVALDGGGETRVRHSASKARGATTAAYGIRIFPTTLLIGRDGKLLGDFSPYAKDASQQIENLLNAKDAAPLRD